MILVDTSVWIDHLHSNDQRLVDLLAADEVGVHPLVIEELALGRIQERTVVLDAMETLRPFPVLSHREVCKLVDGRSLWGRGLNAVDVHLLGSVLLVDGARLWTRDKRLRIAAEEASVALA